MSGTPGEEIDSQVSDSEQRFAFGKNWQRFLLRLSEDRIIEAENSLKSMLQIESFSRLSFLDIGCGSGLFSLAAMRLGAERVLSFDYDPQSVACTQSLKDRFFQGNDRWEIMQGNVLEESFMKGLGEWDICYSWGVLHHTGDMWKGMEIALARVKPGGIFFTMIYNDQGFMSRVWKRVKLLYNSLPSSLKFLVVLPSFVRLWGPTLIKDLLKGNPLHSWKNYIKKRGMSPWDDVIDWVGGYPFQVAKPEEVFRFCRDRGFQLTELITTRNSAGNEFVFIRSA